jgi:hypothetical protein
VNLSTITKIEPHQLILAPSPKGGRPAIGVRLVPAGRTIDVYTVHAWSGGGADGPDLLNSIARASGNTHWFAAGDYNRPADKWPTLPRGVVLCPSSGKTHQRGGTLDYAFRSGNSSITGAVMPITDSDHDPVAFTL